MIARVHMCKTAVAQWNSWMIQIRELNRMRTKPDLTQTDKYQNRQIGANKSMYTSTSKPDANANTKRRKSGSKTNKYLSFRVNWLSSLWGCIGLASVVHGTACVHSSIDSLVVLPQREGPRALRHEYPRGAHREHIHPLWFVPVQQGNLCEVRKESHFVVPVHRSPAAR